jgi:hypothetical protein
MVDDRRAPLGPYQPKPGKLPLFALSLGNQLPPLALILATA